MTAPASVYLDYQSAKPTDPRVVEAMLPYFGERFGNPASLHAVGDAATAALGEARLRLASALGAASAKEIVFTSGATEAANLGISGYCMRNRRQGTHVIISEVEHISILNIAKYLGKNGFEVSRVPPDQFGRISPEKVRARLKEDTLLVSVGWASNEIGTVQRLGDIAEALAESNAVLHTDAVAVQSQLPIDLESCGAHLVSLSSNDFYGPPGVGALYVRSGVKVGPVMLGGGQEDGLRSGTENLPGIVGMSLAAEIAARETPADGARMSELRDRLVEGVLASIPDAHLNGHPTERLPGNAHFRFDGVEGESLLLSLKDKGISAATGSACSSKTLEPSRTLISCGLLHEEAHGSLEFTFGRWSQASDVDRVLEVLPAIVGRLRELSPIYRPKGPRDEVNT